MTGARPRAQCAAGPSPAAGHRLWVEPPSGAEGGHGEVALIYGKVRLETSQPMYHESPEPVTCSAHNVILECIHLYIYLYLSCMVTRQVPLCPVMMELLYQ